MLDEPYSDLTRDSTEEVQASEVLSSVLARAYATIDLTAATAKLAVAEMRLALSSAALLTACLVLLAVMTLITWLVILAFAFAALQLAGLSALGALACLVIFQLLICAAIIYTMVALGRNLSFPLTRAALRPVTEPESYDPGTAT